MWKSSFISIFKAFSPVVIREHPMSLTRKRVFHPLWFGGGDTRLGEMWREGPNSDDGTDTCGTLGIYVLCGSYKFYACVVVSFVDICNLIYSVRYTEKQQKGSTKIAFSVYSSYALIHLSNQSNTVEKVFSL
jgi:hypothetical protein